MNRLLVASLLLLVGCNDPVGPDDRWLIVEASGPYVGVVTFSDGHRMTSSGTSGSAFPLYAGETLCWTFERIESAPGYLSVHVGDRAGRRKDGLTKTTEPNGRVAGCV